MDFGAKMLEAPSMSLAFLAGVLSFLTPCVLPLIPGYISFMSGVSLAELEKGSDQEGGRWQAMKPVVLCSLAFVVGLCMVYMTLGVVGSLASRAMGSDFTKNWSEAREYMVTIGGIIVILLGIHMTGLFRIKSLYTEKRLDPGKGGTIPRAFVLGLAFALGWTPCTGPILGAIWLYSATQKDPLLSFLLMTMYSLGLAVPIFLTGIATKQFYNVFDRVKMHFKKIEIASGAILMLFGIIMIFQGNHWMSEQLLRILPNFVQKWG